jgi:glucosamine--fructose-6-phosphate aminotransferase (isomerizing)
VVGVCEGSVFVSSDIPALLPLTRRVVYVENGEMVLLSGGGVEIRRLSDWGVVVRDFVDVSWTFEMAEKQGYPHFMLKEIYEQPLCLQNAVRLQDDYLDLLTRFLDRSKQIYLLACGTSYNACFAASYMFSRLCNLSTVPVIASEFIERYGDAVNIDSTILAVSQSGETADVLHAIEYARFKAATILGLTNTIGSTLTRVSRAYLCQQSGPEIGVAASKTFSSQIMVLAQLALRLAKLRGKVSQARIDELTLEIEGIPDIVSEVLETQVGKVRLLVEKYRDRGCFFFLGRGISSATALEGRLKLLEISYIPSISYSAGESKHGAISLIEPGFPVIFVCPGGGSRRVLVGNIMELKARGACVIAVVDEGDEEIKGLVDDFVCIPGGVSSLLSPIPYVVPLQLFAYYMAVARGCDPDKPRNLAKSVTVL